MNGGLFLLIYARLILFIGSSSTSQATTSQITPISKLTFTFGTCPQHVLLEQGQRYSCDQTFFPELRSSVLHQDVMGMGIPAKLRVHSTTQSRMALQATETLAQLSDRCNISILHRGSGPSKQYSHMRLTLNPE